MRVRIKLSGEFERQFKRLSRKYPSLHNDLLVLRKELTENPLRGDQVGSHVRKVRMTVASKGKGKSGGARVLTYNLSMADTDDVEITLLTIYDKGEISNVSDSYIKFLVSLIQ